MSTASSLRLDRGRVSQKLRTRKALLQAARELLEQSQPVTVAKAAQLATISPATAYRYFSDAGSLVSEAMLDLQFEPSDDLFASAPSLRDRVLAVHRHLFAFTRRNEAAYRLYFAKTLRDWMEGGPPERARLRGARRIPLYRQALEPVQKHLSPNQLTDLVNQLSAASGLEIYVALKDVCRLDDGEADRAAEAIVTSILAAAFPAELLR